ncbi:MAG: aminotransferase class I/II-fold pyridoxal phosphate-dependent enzyme [Candidatus Aminicenantes bacterium]|nr:aminotransferase class I/II-fold pyridoxal phosphate-dependent enzyme [Candidatus Aminicenantes bacterium]
MKIEHFKMGRMQSTWENVVDYNLSESGVHPLSLEELASGEELEDIVKTSLGYSQTNGTPELRKQIARLYPGISVEQILTTVGSSEANFLLMWSLVEPGDEVVVMMPNYMQMWGLLRGFGAKVKPFWLRESLGWAPDMDELRRLVTKKTKLIILTNPNNPTGAVLAPEAMNAIISLADKSGAWIIADEVYQGAEREGERTPSFFGKHERVIAVNGLSKAYGLPGVRIGWIVGPEELIQKIWSYHDYTTISPSTLSDRLARIALAPQKKRKILARTRQILRKNYPVLEKWLENQAGLFEFVPPRAGAIALVRYKLNIHSAELVNRLIREKSVLIVPGEHFEMGPYLRFGYGAEPDYLKQGLARVEDFLAGLRACGG